MSIFLGMRMRPASIRQYIFIYLYPIWFFLPKSAILQLNKIAIIFELYIISSKDYILVKERHFIYLWGKYGDGGATSEGLGSPLRNFWVFSWSAFALTDLKRFRKLLLLPEWTAPFRDSIGTRSSVGVDVPDTLPRFSWCMLDSETTMPPWEEAAPILLQALRRNKADKPLLWLLGDVEDVNVVVVFGDDDVPPDSEKYDGLSVNMRIEQIQVTQLDSLIRYSLQYVCVCVCVYGSS